MPGNRHVPFLGEGAAVTLFPLPDFLACYVNPETSLLNVDQAAAAWPGQEPVLQTAFERASTNQLASGRKNLPASFGVSRTHQSRSESSAQGSQAEAKSRDAVTRRRARARKRKR
jgi:hypothetical protein